LILLNTLVDLGDGREFAREIEDRAQTEMLTLRLRSGFNNNDAISGVIQE
jgi:hypothetical protein